MQSPILRSRTSAVEVVVGDRVGQPGDQVLARARRAAGRLMTSRSMNTVQRSPRRIGAVDCSASSANSPMMAMPSFSACSSRNEPVPAAQASFMAKSTTMPSCRLMNLESWPPISKMVSTCRSMLAADEVGAGLVGGDLVVDHVGAEELADELAARAGGAHAEHADAVAELVADVGEALASTTSTGRASRLGVDLLDHSPSSSITTRLVDTEPMSMPM